MDLNQDQKYVMYAMIFGVGVIFAGLLASWFADEPDAMRQDSSVTQVTDDADFIPDLVGAPTDDVIDPGISDQLQATDDEVVDEMVVLADRDVESVAHVSGDVRTLPTVTEAEPQQAATAEHTGDEVSRDAIATFTKDAANPVVSSSGAVIPAAVSDLIERYPHKLLLVHFWRTDCDSCSASFEWLSDMTRRYADKGLTIIAVSEDQEVEQAANFLAQMPHAFEHIVDEKHVLATTFWLQGLPSTFLVTPTGDRLHAETGFDRGRRGQYEDAIRYGLDQLPPQ